MISSVLFWLYYMILVDECDLFSKTLYAFLAFDAIFDKKRCASV